MQVDVNNLPATLRSAAENSTVMHIMVVGARHENAGTVTLSSRLPSGAVEGSFAAGSIWWCHPLSGACQLISVRAAQILRRFHCSRPSPNSQPLPPCLPLCQCPLVQEALHLLPSLPDLWALPATQAAVEQSVPRAGVA